MDDLPDPTAGVRLAYARSQLEAPAAAIREYVAAAAAPVTGAAAAADFATLQRFADELAARVSRTFDAPLPASDPPRMRELRHDLRAAAGRIVSHCDLLIEDEIEGLPPGTGDELNTIRMVALRVVDRVNTLLGGTAEAGDGGTLNLDELLRNISTGPRLNQVAPGRLLLADDSPDNRDLLGRLLGRGAGHEVTPVPDGEAALAALETGAFDVLLLDVMMPGLNGFEVLRRVREHPTWQHLPVVMMSALGEEAAVIAAIAAGADDYLRRPFNPTLLHARVNACIERKRFRDREVAYQQQIDKLIRALFPHEVADEVRTHGTVPPRRHDGVGVLFLDVVGFTTWCEARRDRPEHVTEALQFLVGAMEEVAEKHGVLKIKTIGDAFLGTTGLVRPNPDPVGTLVRCGAEMLRAVGRHPDGWQVRVGVNVGPVIAGIIGTAQFQFDVFGSTVNVAARLQNLAHPGGMALSEAAWSALVAPVRATRREEEVKGVGRIPLWDVDLAHVVDGSAG